ncbi:hypothetical protein FK220_016990 [Flavobacteriaceae bacterium TP-CH-4]|uniref:DUF4149 domain-containing protein n=2 Tax=Pelagihabitans pacificus TaxID=2696054 RepID=A0A967ECB4_9FLAO|nr:hypothetical protein [Pelagihabitans pacificus]
MVRLLFDFGLVILIWMVQLVVYPSFRYYKKSDLMRWHERYTKAISIIVVPLMFGQLFLVIFQIVEVFDVVTATLMGLVIAVWISTFAQFVPMHHAIAKGDLKDGLLRKLVRQNWLRTFLWSTILIIDATAVFYS